MDELLQDFIAETRETLAAVASEIIAWEADPSDRARLDAIFRFVHTVKGSCGFLDLPRLERLSHAAEDVLSQVRSGERVADRGLVNGVLAIIDRIGELVDAIDAGHALDDGGEDALIAALEPGAADAFPIVVANGNQRATTRSVRLSVDLLDRMMSGMSEMVLARNELARRLRDVTEPGVEAALERLSSTVAEMRDTVSRTRMQRIDSLFSAVPRIVRDASAELGKRVTLQVEGSDVELDREMIEVMRDPLLHIIRNAIDHGIEAPDARRAAGKREAGRLLVAARQAGNQIVIEVSDDGAGIDTGRIIAKLARDGRDPAQLHTLSEAAKCALIFEPGFTTKDAVTSLSGRGVGMDVVRDSVDQIGGRIDLDNRPGSGLTLSIHVPLTLSVLPTIIVGVADHRFAIPRPVIEEIVSEQNATIRVERIGNAHAVAIRGRRVPMVDLASILGVAAPDATRPSVFVVVNVGASSIAIGVDAVIDHEELVIRPSAPAVMAAGVYAGQALPDTGQPMLLLDSAGIAAAAGIRSGLRAESIVEDEPPAAEERVSALLFDDLDGVRRLMPLAAIERIETVPAGAIAEVAGRLRLTIDERVLPLLASGDVVPDEPVSVLQIRDGGRALGYAIREASDIVALPEDWCPADAPGRIAGIALIDGHPIEVVDPHALLAEHQPAQLEERPICALAGTDTSWLRVFVRPLIESMGYRVVTDPKAIASAGLVVAMEDDPAGVEEGRLLRLSSTPSPGGAAIDRHDRSAIIAALAERRKQAA